MELKRATDYPHHRASGAERLGEMARFLDTLPRGKLTFAHWYDRGRGCAVGLAARDPWFMAQGLRLDDADSLKDCRPAFGAARDWAAVTAFFEIAPSVARTLFTRGGYQGEVMPNPKLVAANIRRHLARTGAFALSA